MGIDIIDTADQIDLRDFDLNSLSVFEKVSERMDGVFIDEFEGDLLSINFWKPYHLGNDLVAPYCAVVTLVPRNIAKNASFTLDTQLRNPLFLKVDRGG